jgi:hypothetical protein
MNAGRQPDLPDRKTIKEFGEKIPADKKAPIESALGKIKRSA